MLSWISCFIWKCVMSSTCKRCLTPELMAKGRLTVTEGSLEVMLLSAISATSGTNGSRGTHELPGAAVGLRCFLLLSSLFPAVVSTPKNRLIYSQRLHCFVINTQPQLFYKRTTDFPIPLVIFIAVVLFEAKSCGEKGAGMWGRRCLTTFTSFSIH